LEDPVHALLRQLAQPVRSRPGERLEPRRQRVRHLALNVDVGVHLIDDDLRNLLADVFVAQQPRARVGPVVRVEHLAIGPDREDRQQRKQRSDREEAAHEVAPTARETGRFGRHDRGYARPRAGERTPPRRSD
jgi:hypothetical protein